MSCVKVCGFRVVSTPYLSKLQMYDYKIGMHVLRLETITVTHSLALRHNSYAM
jgi:hypothetical protein